VAELRNVRPAQAIAAFERAGGVVREGGPHANVKMPNGQLLTFSHGRRPIKIGLLKAMLWKSGLTEDEFEAFLHGGR
jgi:predicted RNA binding protein YcfA (HicA-like mRNA interferase family)